MNLQRCRTRIFNIHDHTTTKRCKCHSSVSLTNPPNSCNAIVKMMLEELEMPQKHLVMTRTALKARVFSCQLFLSCTLSAFSSRGWLMS